MNIVPSSTIYLLKNIPLNPDYNNTIRFSSPTAQVNYFGDGSLHVATFTNQSYQRYGSNKLRIRGLAENLYDANYLAFQNTGHKSGAKWFYAFITSIDYVNENCTEITYELDVIQTYLFDIEVGECFVEREHTETDELQDWVVPENIETGEIMKQYVDHITFGTMNVMTINQYFEANPQQYDINLGKWMTEQGTFDALKIEQYLCANGVPADATHPGADTLGSKMHDNAVYADNMMDIIIAPEICANGKEYDALNDDIVNRNDNYPGVKAFTIDKPTNIDTYVPINKKVLTYPYVSLMIDDNMGSSKEYLYEYFYSSDGKCDFKIYGNVVPVTVVNTTPMYYKRSKINWNESLETTGFPTCGSNTDSYRLYLAENKNQLLLKGAVSASNAITGYYFDDPFSITEGVVQAASLMAQVSDKKVNSFKRQTTAYNNSIQMALGHMGLSIYNMTITKGMAESIDHYFYMYGYAVHKLKVPNVFGGGRLRPYWNYFKTNNCNLSKENCPASVSKKICQIFDKGITFWENPYKVGDYRQGRNVPVTP